MLVLTKSIPGKYILTDKNFAKSNISAFFVSQYCLKYIICFVKTTDSDYALESNIQYQIFVAESELVARLLNCRSTVK